MQRVELGPPRRLADADTAVAHLPPPPDDTLRAAIRAGLRISCGALAPPSEARERRRPFFRPRRGLLRRLERFTSQWLDRHVWWRVPGITLPYDLQLRRGLTLGEVTFALDGPVSDTGRLRLLLLSDVHAGAFVSRRTLEETFDRLLAVEPDAIVLAGDLVTCSLDELERHRRAFARLSARLGVWAVLGNHDHYTGRPRELASRVEECGIGVLHNRRVRLGELRGAVELAGVDDLSMGAPDIDRALAGAAGPVVLVSHHPDLFFEAARRGVPLVLAGHTHGGQVRLPHLPLLVRQSRYRLDAGRYRSGASELVVSRGLGASGVPFRLGCPPEAVLVTLVRRNRA